MLENIQIPLDPAVVEMLSRAAAATDEQARRREMGRNVWFGLVGFVGGFVLVGLLARR